MRYVAAILLLLTGHLSMSRVANATPGAAGVINAIVVDAKGHGDFTTVQAALNSLSPDSAAPRHILIRSGIYHEKDLYRKEQHRIGSEE